MKVTVDLHDDDFGTVLNCAVRYSLGRTTYLPSLVVNYITPLLPYLSDGTLQCFDQDIVEQQYMPTGYGMECDKKDWMRFHKAVRNERTRRGHELYKSWREDIND